MKQYSIGHTVLRVIAGAGEITLDHFFSRKYSYAKIWRPLLGLDRSRKITRQTISTILWRLKQEGLVERIGAKKIAKWHMTPKGRRYLQEKISGMTNIRKSDGITRLVIFDIPEQERKKRDTIRAELVAYNFQQLQKSVWIGKYPLPEEFVTLLDDLRLTGKVHIFSVRDYGSLDALK